MPKNKIIPVMLLVFAMSGCAATWREVRSNGPLPGAECGVVFSADGAGAFLASTVALQRVIEQEKLPLCVEPVEWQHGRFRVLADHVDYAHVRSQGKCLAERIMGYRQSCPDRPIYLVGHSDGCAVVLAAIEELPPGIVERVILLAPAVSANYDLRPALSRVAVGVDVFTSKRDLFCLGLGTRLFGTTDRRRTAASGRVGFRPKVVCPEDSVLYAKLRQHPWNKSLLWTGNWGGHYGCYRPQYLRAFVVPLLRQRG